MFDDHRIWPFTGTFSSSTKYSCSYWMSSLVKRTIWRWLFECVLTPCTQQQRIPRFVILSRFLVCLYAFSNWLAIGKQTDFCPSTNSFYIICEPDAIHFSTVYSALCKFCVISWFNFCVKATMKIIFVVLVWSFALAHSLRCCSFVCKIDEWEKTRSVHDTTNSQTANSFFVSSCVFFSLFTQRRYACKRTHFCV